LDAKGAEGVVTLAKFLCAVGGIAWSVVVMLNAYGLTIHSWSWLIWGTIGTGLLMVGSGAWSKDKS
jgi:hypothetical protein